MPLSSSNSLLPLPLLHWQHRQPPSAEVATICLVTIVTVPGDHGLARSSLKAALGRYLGPPSSSITLAKVVGLGAPHNLGAPSLEQISFCCIYRQCNHLVAKMTPFLMMWTMMTTPTLPHCRFCHQSQNDEEDGESGQGPKRDVAMACLLGIQPEIYNTEVSSSTQAIFGVVQKEKLCPPLCRENTMP